MKKFTQWQKVILFGMIGLVFCFICVCGVVLYGLVSTPAMPTQVATAVTLAVPTEVPTAMSTMQPTRTPRPTATPFVPGPTTADLDYMGAMLPLLADYNVAVLDIAKTMDEGDVADSDYRAYVFGLLEDLIVCGNKVRAVTPSPAFEQYHTEVVAWLDDMDQFAYYLEVALRNLDVAALDTAMVWFDRAMVHQSTSITIFNILMDAWDTESTGV